MVVYLDLSYVGTLPPWHINITPATGTNDTLLEKLLLS